MDATDEVMALRHRLDYLTLVTEALWSFISDQGHTEQELQDRIRRIDLSDGRLDNRHLHRVSCTRCRAVILTDHCQFCGTRVEDVFAAA
ncbi:MAG TPA: hypothetical protein VIA81_02205 [Acidimicrobiia bacterium]|jgi:hypothetical protein